MRSACLGQGQALAVDAAAVPSGRRLQQPSAHRRRASNVCATGFGLLGAADGDARRRSCSAAGRFAGTGALLDDAVVRLVVALKAASLARGYSGVRWSVIDALVEMNNRGVVPCIPSQGSVGASGDLAPLAHLSAVLIGEGTARVGTRVVAGRDALREVGLAPLELAPKEGLALLNGTQVSTALTLAALFATERACAAAFVAGVCRSTPASPATCRSTPAFTRCAAIAARRTPRLFIARCSKGAKSAPRTRNAIACRIRTACAASRR
jgi:histidine ammonia-lyase